jgi:hypothetical protein
MKKHLLAAVLLVVFFIGISTHTSVGNLNGNYISSFLGLTLSSDTSKTVDPAENMLADSSMMVWKEWKTVQNFAYGKDRGNLPMIADLQSLHPFFRDKINQLIKNCKSKGIELSIVESYRTHAKQSEYFGMGKKYTRSAGGKSKHQYGLAVDVVPVIDSVAVWDNVILWRKIGVEGEKLGLRWGGRWKSPYDPAHFEWSGGMTTYQLAQGVLPLIPKTNEELYPCIEEDIQQLRNYWEAWEAEQASLMRQKSTSSMASSQRP